jgi:hypothetical protein
VEAETRLSCDFVWLHVEEAALLGLLGHDLNLFCATYWVMM